MSQKYFNIILVCALLCLIAGTVYLWRDYIQGAEKREIAEIEPVKFQDIAGVKIETSTDDTVLVETSTAEQEEREISIAETSQTTSEQAKPQSTERFNLDVPFISQAPEKNWDQPWQDACEEAALLMLDGYYSNYDISVSFAVDRLREIIAWETSTGWGGSIPATHVASTSLKQFDRELEIIENPSIEGIKQYIRNGHPVYVVADGKQLPNPHFTNGGPVYHALIVRGFTEDRFITNDPGTQFGENFTYAYDDLMNAIHDWNDGDVPNGRKVILVLK